MPEQSYSLIQAIRALHEQATAATARMADLSAQSAAAAEGFNAMAASAMGTAASVGMLNAEMATLKGNEMGSTGFADPNAKQSSVTHQAAATFGSSMDKATLDALKNYQKATGQDMTLEEMLAEFKKRTGR